MALPTWVNAGSIATGAGALTLSPPSGLAVDDICYLGIESFGTDPVPSFTNKQLSTFDDWVQVATQVQGGTRLTIFRAKVIAIPVLNPTLGDVGDHLATRMVAVRGADTAAPNETITLGTDATSDTSGTMPAHTTGGADRLVLLFAVADLPDATGTAEYSWTSFGNLANGAERTDNSVTSGNGGSLSWATGELATAGAIGTINYTKANAGVKAHAVIAVKPPAGGTPQLMAATLASTSDLTAVLKVEKLLAASLASTSDLTAVLLDEKALAANLASTSGLDGTLNPSGTLLAATLASQSDFASQLLTPKNLAAALASSGALNAVLLDSKNLQAVLASVSDLQAALRDEKALAAILSSQGFLNADLQDELPGTGRLLRLLLGVGR